MVLGARVGLGRAYTLFRVCSVFMVGSRLVYLGKVCTWAEGDESEPGGEQKQGRKIRSAANE